LEKPLKKKRKYPQFFFKPQLNEAPEEKFPEKMDRKGNEKLKPEEIPKASGNSGREKKLVAPSSF